MKPVDYHWSISSPRACGPCLCVCVMIVNMFVCRIIGVVGFRSYTEASNDKITGA